MDKFFDVIVIGTGAAGYNAALRIKQINKKSVAIITEGKNCGTSRNTGSDKQTYYKLGLGGDAADSVRKMAETLFDGGSVDGDNALCEAALSSRCFLALAESGVPFPHNRYGEYIGYKTDHDPMARATSAGPLTSKFMTEALEKKVNEANIPVFDNLLAVELLKDDDSICGLLCLNTVNGEYVSFGTPNVILATGGPAGIYADSVFPECHHGSTGLAVDAGAKLQNMTEWQYGLASINPRWNVSGTYMQVLPRFVSIDRDGNEFEFLTDYFNDIYEALSAVFLKGYQWPFDSKKVLGSSIIDLLVWRECVVRNRKVYLDFTRNPFALDEIQFEKLSLEAYNYLKDAKSLFGTPIERLDKMNSPAIELYLSKGVDIRKEYLEIALCAQHNNGGIAVDLWWQSTVTGLFAVGECAGTHGVARPGGSALNAGQVGSLRAAQFVSESGRTLSKNYKTISEEIIKKHVSIRENSYNKPSAFTALKKVQRDMSDCAAAIRNTEKMKELLSDLPDYYDYGISDEKELYFLYLLKDTVSVQRATLTAMIDFSDNVNCSRGSALYTSQAGKEIDNFPEIKYKQFVDKANFDKIQEISLSEKEFSAEWRNVRPIPEETEVFENIWRQYRENKNIF